MIPKLVLASASPYRARALSDLGYTFESVAADIDERSAVAADHKALSLLLARSKCEAVAKSFEDAVVLGSDQVGVCDGKLLTKPGSASAAASQLRHCSGKHARFYTSVVVSYPAETVPASNTSDAACVVTELQYRSLSDQEINTYIGIDNPLDTAGAFKIESHGLALFSRVTSDDPSALIGLPLIATMRMLRAAGLDPLQQNHRA